MKLNTEQIGYLKDKLSTQLKKNCQFCDKNNWILSDALFEIREFSGGGLVLGSSAVIPIIVITCNNCGNMIFINAVSLKIINKDG